MALVEFVYFSGCPLAPRARSILLSLGISNAKEINQDKLPAGDSYKTYSSPSIFIDGELVIGTRSRPGQCTIVDWQTVESKLAAKLKK